MNEGVHGSHVRSIACWLVIALSMAATLIPWFPEMPNSTLDSSWQFAMNEAVARHFVIGRDVIFTFGPYASVYTHLYHPALYPLTLFATGYLACLYIASLRILSTRLPLAPLVIVCLLFTSCYHAPDAVLYVYPLMVGMIVICDAARARRSLSATHLGILASGFGLLVLVKGSFVPLCIVVMALCSLSLVSQRRIGPLLAAVLSSLGAMMFFWILADQPLLELPTYFRTLVPTISGYSDAMGLLGPRREVVQYLLGATALILIVWRSAEERSLRLMLVALLIAFLFLAFKGGTVRHDGHVVIISAAALVLGSALISTRFPSRYSYSLVVSCVAFFVYTNLFWNALPGTAASRVYVPYQSLVVALDQDVTNTGWRERLFSNITGQIKNEHAVAPGVADIYPLDQAAVIVAGGPWRPRPIFQSYGAYTAILLTANRNHLLGPDAPKRVEFAVTTIDGRLPSLDDGASWPVLLTNYHIVEARPQAVTLERNAATAGYETQVVSQVSANLGDEVKVPSSSDPIWARMLIRQSAIGTIISFLSKAPQLEIVLKMSNGSEAVHRVIAGMMQTDFLLSPSVSDTREFVDLYASGQRQNQRSVVSFKVRSLSPFLRAWQPEYQIQFRQF